jgi:hypothetical protein
VRAPSIKSDNPKKTSVQNATNHEPSIRDDMNFEVEGTSENLTGDDPQHPETSIDHSAVHDEAILHPNDSSSNDPSTPPQPAPRKRPLFARVMRKALFC